MAGISGFPEWLPGQQIAFNDLILKMKTLFELHGFLPLETPAAERLSTLLSKGVDHEIYRLQRIGEEPSSQELGLRFDLTVPLARYVAQHAGSLIFPYSRYHIAPVWRGERPQAGRYRQFYQCDIDTIAEDVLDTAYDAQILALCQKGLAAMGLSDVVLKVNHCKSLQGLLLFLKIAEDSLPSVIRLIDKADKMSADALQKALFEQGCSLNAIDTLLHIHTKKEMPPIDHSLYEEGVKETQDIIRQAECFGLSKEILVVAPLLARGLDYYTGLMYEAAWQSAPELGSICAGGRYGTLASSFTSKRLPGVGISFGISRIFSKWLQGQDLKQTLAPVLVTVQDAFALSDYILLTEQIRSAGIAVDIYLSKHPLSTQMKYASKRGFQMVIIANGQELSEGKVWVRHLSSGQQEPISRTFLLDYLKKAVGIAG